MAMKTHCTNADRPAKPYPTFPLYAHGNGQWAKKIRGQTHFFGPWADPNGALERYHCERSDLEAGRRPRRTDKNYQLTAPKYVHDSPISKEFRKLLTDVHLDDCPGFYGLRHTALKTKDRDAIRAMMGHAAGANDMLAVYNEEDVDEERLLDVSNYVRGWLFKQSAQSAAGSGGTARRAHAGTQPPVAALWRGGTSLVGKSFLA